MASLCPSALAALFVALAFCGWLTDPVRGDPCDSMDMSPGATITTQRAHMQACKHTDQGELTRLGSGFFFFFLIFYFELWLGWVSVAGVFTVGLRRAVVM